LNPYLKFAPTGKGVLLEPTNSARGLFATCTIHIDHQLFYFRCVNLRI
jgi:hypothetical protein